MSDNTNETPDHLKAIEKEIADNGNLLIGSFRMPDLGLAIDEGDGTCYVYRHHGHGDNPIDGWELSAADALRILAFLDDSAIEGNPGKGQMVLLYRVANKLEKGQPKKSILGRDEDISKPTETATMPLAWFDKELLESAMEELPGVTLAEVAALCVVERLKQIVGHNQGGGVSYEEIACTIQEAAKLRKTGKVPV
jgi:hypothetical protein